MNHALRCLLCDKPLLEPAFQGLCLPCYVRYGGRAGGEGVFSAHRASHSPSLGQGHLATRVSPANIQSIAGFVAPEPEEIAPYFPQFEVLDILGRGGMGVVYKARQRDLDRLVALKVLFPEASNDATFGERFLREAKALARVSHPHIVAVHDFGRSAGLCYLVMEFVDGPNLRQFFAVEPRPVPQIVATMIQVCEALGYAHDQHIVHRDVKPDNILVDRRAGAKLVDFGIAKLAGRPMEETVLTASRQVMGTFFYIAPEQFERPREVDHRADIYALGVVLYEMLTGELPMGRFALPSRRLGTDPRLDRVVMQALEKQPERRYQRVIEMKADLENYLRPPTQATVEVITHISAAAPPPPIVTVRPELLVRGPAIGLLIAGALSTIGLVIAVGVMLGLAVSQALGSGPGFVSLFLRSWWPMIAGTLAGPLVIAAGRRLEHLNSYRFVFAISALAMAVPVVLPSPFDLLDLPMGVWSLCTICRREVRSKFTGSQPLDRVERWLLLLMGVLSAVVLCVLLTGAAR